MSRNQILVITDDRKALQERLTSAALEKCRLTGLESLRYLGFANLSAVIIDAKSIDRTLRKVSLGIRDDDASDALWQLLAQPKGARVFFLVDKMTRPGSDMLALGIDYLLYENLEQLVTDVNSSSPSHGFAEDNSNPGRLLTADDIRHLHKQNIRKIPAGSRLTSWAAEVAESLNFSEAATFLQLIWPVATTSATALKKAHEELFDLNAKYPDLLFMVNPAYLPVFNDLYPSLKGKTVSPVIHWASHGAYTGETSAAMLADLRCAGAVVPACMPYTEPKHIANLLSQAKEHGLTLFSTFTLASSGVCDIIAPESSQRATLTPLYSADMIGAGELPKGPAAILLNKELLKRIPSRKGY
ncbi:MAG: hypothetical protein GX569_08475 [Candidatus Riflebacteria bacterium]|nr:hypothetical protein [Candidatus Riflebacteria bacterium]